MTWCTIERSAKLIGILRPIPRYYFGIESSNGETNFNMAISVTVGWLVLKFTLFIHDNRVRTDKGQFIPAWLHFNKVFSNNWISPARSEMKFTSMAINWLKLCSLLWLQNKVYRKGTSIQQAPSFSAPQSNYRKAYGSLSSGWMNYNYIHCMLLVSYI